MIRVITFSFSLFLILAFSLSTFAQNIYVGPADTDFAVDFLVSDNCSNNQLLVFGTDPGATDCFDPGLDQFAPPPPPTGAFDGRFISCAEGLLIDFKATNPDGEPGWTGCTARQVTFAASTRGGPISVSSDARGSVVRIWPPGCARRFNEPARTS